jgi:hypothetical protein
MAAEASPERRGKKWEPVTAVLLRQTAPDSILLDSKVAANPSDYDSSHLLEASQLYGRLIRLKNRSN